MSSSSNKNLSKSENDPDSDYEMSKDDSNSNQNGSDQASNSNAYQEEELKKEKQKNLLADKIKKENDLYMNNTNQSREDRLEFLLNQTKTYANFLIKGKIEDKNTKKLKIISKRKRKNCKK